MGISKTEVNLRRLLNCAPRQQNQAKLMHYVATLREQLEQLETEKTSDGITSVSMAKLNDYSEKIEALASSISVPKFDDTGSNNVSDVSMNDGSRKEQLHNLADTPGLRRRSVSHVRAEDASHGITEQDQSAPVKLDASAQAHIEKHRKIQEDLTDEMVDLARQLKESSLLMNQSVQNTEKILDSTEKAVEHSLASTGHANTRAGEIYLRAIKTSCLTWLVMFMMTCVFVMVVLLIRVT